MNDYQKPFNFTEAVRESFRDHPHLRRDTVFFSTEDNPLTRQNPFLHSYGSFPMQRKVRTGELDEKLAIMIYKSKREEISYAYISYDHDMRAMIFNPKDQEAEYALPQERELSGAMTFYHELGHLLCKDGFMDGDTRAESSADAYATLRLLQRYGDDARPLLTRESWARASRFLHDRVRRYMTTPVTAQILADSKDGRFNKLTPAETVAVAEEYVEKYRATDEQLQEAREVYANYEPYAPMPERLEFIATTCLSKPEGFSFRLGAIILNPFLHHDGANHNHSHNHMTFEYYTQLPDPLREAFIGLTKKTGIAAELEPLRADLTIDLQRPAPYKPRPFVREI